MGNVSVFGRSFDRSTLLDDQAGKSKLSVQMKSKMKSTWAFICRLGD